MKLTQKEEDFRPVTIVIETEKELAELYVILNSYVYKSGCKSKKIDSVICHKLFTSHIMNHKKAVELLSECDD